MKTWRSGLALACLLVLPAGTGSWSQPAGAPWQGTLVCAFQDGRAATASDGAFTPSPASPISFEVTNIDLEGQLAQIVVRAGASPQPLRVVRALNANHFIEVLAEGFLGLTTIYDPDARTGVYPAVHSRHVGVVGQAVVAQYTGSCKAK